MPFGVGYREAGVVSSERMAGRAAKRGLRVGGGEEGDGWAALVKV